MRSTRPQPPVRLLGFFFDLGSGGVKTVTPDGIVIFFEASHSEPLLSACFCSIFAGKFYLKITVSG
jgi:hypothetical protein